MPPENFNLAVPPNLVQLGRRDLQDRRADNGKVRATLCQSHRFQKTQSLS